METFYVILCLIATVWIAKIALGKKRNLPPSPFPCLPILGHLYLVKSPLHRVLSKLARRHGPMLMLQFGTRRVFLVSSPAAVEECLTTNDIAFANRPHLLAGKHFGYDYTALSWADYGDHWRNLRRIASLELLSAHRLQAHASIREEDVKLFVKKVYEKAMRDGTVDMKSMFFELVLNAIMMMISGKRYYGDSGADVDETRRFQEIVKETCMLMETTNISDYLPWWKWVGGRNLEKQMVALKEKRHEFMQSLLQEQKRKFVKGGNLAGENIKKEQNFIEVLLKLQETQPDYYKDDVIKGLMQVLLSAGTDTSSGTMEWMLSLLLNNPETLKRAHAEIDTYVGGDRLINDSDIPNLPFLRCALIQCFEWERPSNEMIDMSEGKGLTMPKAKPLVAICRPRQKMTKLLAQM
ncbi:CYP81B58 [Artemisia annua]|uniref:CYP81B58 n=1 Tax=Artemisia annua TaxID=35608 RepID=A0A2U1N7X6_ARTAN|nr:CYP81B58 [Artemisia annua]